MKRCYIKVYVCLPLPFGGSDKQETKAEIILHMGLPVSDAEAADVDAACLL